MPDASLLTTFDEIRGKTLRLIKSVSPEDALWRPAGTDNTILWHAGHAFVVVESLVGATLVGGVQGIPAAVPPGWWEVFGWDSHPEQVPADRWPSLDDVAAQLAAQRDRLRPELEKLTDEWLSQRLDPADANSPSRRWEMIHGLHDEAGHGGEIWLLRKLIKHGRAAGEVGRA